jgi:predicted acetylornithine/succinylornithine family transaminase
MAKHSDCNTLFVPTYARTGAPMVKGKGCYLWDAEGTKYLDFTSGIAVSALGHSHPAIVHALKKQGKTLLHASNLFFTQPQNTLAAQLIKHSFGSKVFFCNSGTEAIEAAIKFARKAGSAISGEKFNVLSFSDGFHGRTFGALSATAQEKFHAGFEPLVPGFYYSPFNDIEAAREALKQRQYAAIIVEPIQGESGFNAASTEFLSFLRTAATEHNIALIFDEIQCGCGRSGTLWNYQHHGVEPDMMVLAKPLGGGLPLGAVVCTEAIGAAIKPGDHGTTFGGNPLACALGSVVMSQVSKKSFLSDVNKSGAHLVKQLTKATQGMEQVSGIVGYGLMVGVRLQEDPGAVIAACREQGLLLVKAGHNTVRFLPPLTVSRAEIDAAVKIFKRVLSGK